MSALTFLIPVAILMGGAGLIAFFWSLRSGQYDDPDGDAQRIIFNRDDRPLNEQTHRGELK
ncbi:MAG TPA: cbb3-type cytochrome oxidase assembly protein CcoS [Agrobacterium sp.]|nr:cbb3-type cytochrome oxidase assembly protein CcoS [Agrobacterium pusense]MDH0873839.1 cbb3-type cytochrome oxidase assembly protein CcoS [Agrobacterium pusense]MDH1271199.1 cbb3-type cytochrome oxidase assembly protein CcoS [Agrobacterium pusense]HAU78698.1 cbb3-type cytochrome oxidase assembly protein CcoS [Agrobacterium sp.]